MNDEIGNSYEYLKLELLVEDAVLYSLGNMHGTQFLGPVQVGDGPGHLEDAVKCSGAESQPVHCGLQQLPRVSGQRAESFNLPVAHLGVAQEAGFSKPLELPLAKREVFSSVSTAAPQIVIPATCRSFQNSGHS